MTQLECRECGQIIEHEPLMDFIHKSHENPDYVSFLVPCAICGERNALIDIPIDDYVFNGEAVVLAEGFNEYDRKVLSHANGFMM